MNWKRIARVKEVPKSFEKMMIETSKIPNCEEKFYKALYQQEPIPIVDCNNCEYISITEEEQRKVGKGLHICQVYEKRCFHNNKEHDATYIYPCKECVADEYKNFRGELE